MDLVCSNSSTILYESIKSINSGFNYRLTQYIERKYVRSASLEKREYQVNLANQAIQENCIVVLPTGLGKTAIALQVIAEYLSKGVGGVLFLAPTRVLVNQHYDFLKSNLDIG